MPPLSSPFLSVGCSGQASRRLPHPLSFLSSPALSPLYPHLSLPPPLLLSLPLLPCSNSNMRRQAPADRKTDTLTYIDNTFPCSTPCAPLPIRPPASLPLLSLFLSPGMIDFLAYLRDIGATTIVYTHSEYVWARKVCAPLSLCPRRVCMHGSCCRAAAVRCLTVGARV